MVGSGLRWSNQNDRGAAILGHKDRQAASTGDRLARVLLRGAGRPKERTLK